MAGSNRPISIFVFYCLFVILDIVNSTQYLGKFLGKLSELHHGVSGQVYAVDGRTLHIKDFTYDGQGPAAYFWAGNTRAVSSQGFRIRDENGSPEVLRRYRKEGVTISLPEGKTLNNIKWFSVWCEEFEVNFGDVKIPRNFDFPRPQKIDALSGVHGISSDNIVLVDAQTLLIPNLSYDGEAPDAKFWVGRGLKPSPQGIRVPDENGKEQPLRRYDHKTVVLTLPGDLTVFDIGHFGIWCEAFTVDFGHIRMPQTLNVPPSLKMLGVSPQSKLNCEVLYDDLAFEVRWAIAGDSIVLQLVAKLDNREYMSFGLSGDDTKSLMIEGDVVVAWIDKETLKGYAVDYYLADKSQCSGPKGSCPDERISANTNNIRLLNAATVNGYSIVTYQRPLKASDILDKQILTNTTQPIIWAIGPLNQRNEVSFHTQFTKRDTFLDFGRSANWNCPMPEGDQPAMKTMPIKQKPGPTIPEVAPVYEAATEVSESLKPIPSRTRNGDRRRGQNNRGSTTQVSENSDQSVTKTRNTERNGNNRGPEKSTVSRNIPTPAPTHKRSAWVIPPIQCNEPEDGVFYAQMGPTGGKQGYEAITGHVGWGISWYINGLLIPEINLVRGKTYTFVVEGGFDKDVAAKYHPFYITDDPVGGYEYKTPEERQNVRIFAGASVSRDGTVQPNGLGRLCHWTHQGDSDAEDFASFGAYQRTLELKCDQGEPGVIQWTPNKDTPSTVYYQCFTHRYLGWKINVLDGCDLQSDGSAPVPAYAESDNMDDLLADNDELAGSPSIRLESRIKPKDIESSDEKEASDQITISDVNIPQINLVSQEPTSFLELPIYLESQPTGPIFYSENPTVAPLQIDLKSNVIDLTAQHSFRPEIKSLSPNLSSTVNKMNQTILVPVHLPPKHIYTPGTIIRRPVPQSRPPFIVKNHMRPHRPHQSLMPYKKPYYKPLLKMPALKRPLPINYPTKLEHKPMLLSNIRSKPQNIVILQPHVMNSPVTFNEPTQGSLLHVEISPQQASTEREVEMQTIRPDLRPAVNTGFHPETIVIEGGFRPIIHREIEHRTSNKDGPELEYESAIGVIDVSENKQKEKCPENLEPVFMPSPLDSPSKKSGYKLYKRRANPKKNFVRLLSKRGKSDDNESEEDTDEIAEAAERVESYYLPPDNRKILPKERPKQPSNIDIPPGTVVTYDGRKVSGASLTIRISDRNGASDSRSSKATELIKTTPQFAPFKGELPPLEPIIDVNAPQLKLRGVLNRDLDTPDLPPPSSSTRLSAVKRDDPDKTDVRFKRETNDKS